MAIYTGYFDESSDEHHDFFHFGGLVLDAEQVEDFDRSWMEIVGVLPQKNGNPYFHMTDFVGGYDVYEDEWKGRFDDKLKTLTAMAKVISRFAFQTFAADLNMPEYGLFDQYVKWSEISGHPYAMACRIGYQQLMFWANKNSIFTPVKMVVEARHGMAEVYESFERDKLPHPSPEDKSTPALHAADYIAWMRSKELAPTYPYRQIKASWKQLNPCLHTCQSFGLPEYKEMARNIMRANEGRLLPARVDDNYLVTYNNSPKRVRTMFVRKPVK